mgnify:CR=1 FL=1
MVNLLLAQKSAHRDKLENALDDLLAQRESLDKLIEGAEKELTALNTEIDLLKKVPVLSATDLQALPSRLLEAQSQALGWWAGLAQSAINASTQKQKP